MRNLHVYHVYFVSYMAENATVGRCEMPSRHKIVDIKQIAELEAELRLELKLKSVVIINYQLLRTE